MVEELLLYRVKKGDTEAFAQLYEKYAEYALRVATAITKSEANAADAVQETFIRVYHHIGSYNLNKPFKPWFYKILINECNRILKKTSKVYPISDYLERESHLAGEDAHDFVEYEGLYRAIEDLDDKIRIPVVLKYLQGFREAEIAQILGTNINTVKSRLYKGRQKLKKFMKSFEERSDANESQF